MDRNAFFDRVPFAYHLTDERNLDFIRNQRRLLSTVEIATAFALDNADDFVTLRRPVHVQVTNNGNTVFIRDQRPINAALDRCLTDGWTREDFIRHLNSRVFFWPNIKRLEIHYGRYAAENPIILRIPTVELLNLNNHVEFCRINSGATRPIARLGGIAVPRGPHTFQSFADFNHSPREVVEITFPGECILPAAFEIGRSPQGPWDLVNL